MSLLCPFLMWVIFAGCHISGLAHFFLFTLGLQHYINLTPFTMSLWLFCGIQYCFIFFSAYYSIDIFFGPVFHCTSFAISNLLLKSYIEFLILIIEIISSRISIVEIFVPKLSVLLHNYLNVLITAALKSISQFQYLDLLWIYLYIFLFFLFTQTHFYACLIFTLCWMWYMNIFEENLKSVWCSLSLKKVRFCLCWQPV